MGDSSCNQGMKENKRRRRRRPSRRRSGKGNYVSKQNRGDLVVSGEGLGGESWSRLQTSEGSFGKNSHPSQDLLLE